MAGRVLVAVLWAGGLGLLFLAIRLPGPALDIYIHDRYVAVSKRLLITLMLLAVVIPVFIVAVRVRR